MQETEKTTTGFASVAVLGAGTMGHALALVHALAGCVVRLYDREPRALERARRLVAHAAATLVEAGEIAPEAAAAARDRIETVRELESALAAAELVIETVTEDPGIKKDLFRDVAERAPAGAIVASNTSYLDPFALVPEALQPRAAIAHWYTPPYVLDLVDLVPGPATEAWVLDRLETFYRAIGKHPVRLPRLIPGYVANRLQAALTREALRLLDEEGIAPEVVDTAIREGLALRLLLQGQLEKADFTGLELLARTLANRSYTPPPPIERSPTLDRLIAQGRTGVLAGRGFYDYGGRDPAELFRERDLRLLALKRAWRRIARSTG
ncbi:MAG: 3-hydroxyacyl-CoA dehydrogenase family protein [Geminicoccaceae bacterium]|nr:3-hydroxyacyl-CoA dehydrogenase family protein [Geminicoccaceae bacterium]MDW8124160.1 3-hydroxyacyl-CoA dehydrogenase family protein [Geminicoccaceae bacterium]